MGLNRPKIFLFVRARLLPENMKHYGAYNRLLIRVSSAAALRMFQVLSKCIVLCCKALTLFIIDDCGQILVNSSLPIKKLHKYEHPVYRSCNSATVQLVNTATA